jgi:hypothetical protein
MSLTDNAPSQRFRRVFPNPFPIRGLGSVSVLLSRTGLKDTLRTPDGSRVPDNAALVTGAIAVLRAYDTRLAAVVL